MEYVVIDGTAFDLATESDDAKDAMLAAGEQQADVWVCPQTSIEAAEAVGFEGAYKNGTKLFV